MSYLFFIYSFSFCFFCAAIFPIFALEKPQILNKKNDNNLMQPSDHVAHNSLEQIVLKNGEKLQLTCAVFVLPGQEQPKIIWSVDGLPISTSSMDYQILACLTHYIFILKF